MPFSYLVGELSAYVLEAHELRQAADQPTLPVDASRGIRGLIFVSLFGAYERTVTGCVTAAVSEANRHAIPNQRLKAGLLPLALHPDAMSLRTVSNSRFWERCQAFFEKARSTDSTELADIFPKDGSFMMPSQLELIWSMFELAGDPWPHPRMIGRIKELCGIRNEIAHGQTRASDIGGRFSTSDIEQRIQDVEALCSHIVSAFQTGCSVSAGFEV